MKKIILGVLLGLVSWFAIVSVAGAVMLTLWPAYAAVADEMTFTLPMMIARLAIGAVALLIAARVTAIIEPHGKAALGLGVALLITFIPIHVSLWDRFPVWYHLTFLLTLIPLALLGARLGGRAARLGPSALATRE